jgi:hypothetical protein
MPTETLYPQAAASIIDRAFILCEMASLASLGDDTDQVRDAATHYPEALRSCLEAHDWSFARRTVDLPEAVRPQNVPADPAYPYFYQLPGDMVRLRAVQPDRARWQIEGIYLRADRPGPLFIRYTRTIQNEQQLTATFREAVAAELALRIGPRWLGTAGKLDLIQGLARQARMDAVRDDRQTASQVSWHGGPLTDWTQDIYR